MISRTAREASPLPAWRRRLAAAIADRGELAAALGIGEALAAEDSGPGAMAAVEAAERQFRLRVPRGFVARMRPGDPADPLLAQVLPRAAETAEVPGFTADPLAERDASPAPGVLQKYRGRALLVVTGACAIHCRYCFRRHFPYAEESLSPAKLEGALGWLAADPSISEVILSGGDPLSLPDDRLAELAGRLAAIPHLRRLRVHTRLPVVVPERVDRPLLDWLAGGRLAPVVVIHANHAREIDPAVRAALGRLRRAGVTLLNQAVLLRGVNDRVEALAELSEALFAAGVLPYYLHLLDPVAGAAHFEVGEDEGRRLVAEVAARLPGYLVPRLVRERPGAPAKLPVELRLGDPQPAPAAAGGESR
jgi:EF-P beta-lysylation protein EpmB